MLLKGKKYHFLVCRFCWLLCEIWKIFKFARWHKCCIISHYPSLMSRYTSATTKSTQICTQNPLTNISTFSSLPFTLTTRENYPIQPPSSNTPYISTNYVFDQRRKKLANYLMKRGYSRRFLQRAITRVRAIPRHETLKQQEHTNSTTDRTPFVSTFTPLFIKFLRF